jgi:hypothetical protein
MKNFRTRTIGLVALLAMLAAPTLSSAFSSGGTRRAAPNRVITEGPPTVVTPPQEERSAAPVPEPGALLLFGAGALVAGVVLRKRQN